MSEQSEERKRLNPSILQTALLDEIAERLLDIQKLLRVSIAEGVVEPIEPVAATSIVKRIVPLKPWFSMVVVNDGPDSVNVLVNSEKSFDWHQVLLNETYPVDMGTGVIADMLLQCREGETATVRVVGAR